MKTRSLSYLSILLFWLGAFTGASLAPRLQSAHAQTAPAAETARQLSTATAKEISTALERAAKIWGKAKVIQGGSATVGSTTVGTATGFSGAMLSSNTALACVALAQATVTVAYATAAHIYVSRVGSIVTFGTPYGASSQDIAFPLLKDIRAKNALPEPFFIPVPSAPGQENPDEPRMGRIYVTYSLYNVKSGLYYSGRTSGPISLNKDWETQARMLVRRRYSGQEAVLKELGFRQAVMDAFGEIAPYTGAKRF